jgi:O-antigen ligase
MAEVIAIPRSRASCARASPAHATTSSPDVTPASVHNTYVQMLADLGLIGFVLFITAIASIGLAIGRLLREVRDGPFWIPAWSSALGLVVVMVWLNDNALFGGQVETIVMATLVGILGAIARRTPTT